VERQAGVDSRTLFLCGTARAVIRIPEGFSGEMERFIDEEGTTPFGDRKIVWEADPALDATYRWFIRASIALAVQEAILDSVAQTKAGREASADAARDFSREAPRDPASRVIPTPLQQTVPGWSLFAMFFIVVPLSNSFIRERQDGTLRRLMTYPVSRASIVAGKLAPYLAINLVQFALMLLVGLYVVPLFGDLSLQLGAHPGHLALVTLAAAMAATGYGALVASLARTIEQAGAFGATSIIVMAVIGGVMVPGFVMPQVMQKLQMPLPKWKHADARPIPYMVNVSHAGTMNEPTGFHAISPLRVISNGSSLPMNSGPQPTTWANRNFSRWMTRKTIAM